MPFNTSSQMMPAIPARKKNGASQLKCCARNKPDGTPSAAATENAVITIPMPVARRAGGTTSLTIAITSAPEMPPNEPHTARDASNAAKLCDIPHATVPSTKPA
jgi:hypothetical protein